MAKIKAAYITCDNCRTKFPSPIFIDDTEVFDAATVSGNTVQCPNPACRKILKCNRENMSYVLADDSGGFRGHDVP